MHPRRAILARAAFVLIVVVATPSLGLAGGDTDEDPHGERLRAMLARYDRHELDSTIPVEREILRLREMGAGRALLPFLSHPRFGTCVLWALSELGVEGADEAAITMLDRREPAERAHASLWFAGLGTERTRAWLRELAADETLDEAARSRVQAARLRAGSPDARERLRGALRSEEPDARARGLLLAAEAKLDAYLARMAESVPDATPLETPVRSRFPVVEITHQPNGWTTETSTYPMLSTVGEVALEAANRLVAPTTPEEIAWWYEVEKGARFGPTAEGRALLEQQVGAAAAASEAGSMTLRSALRRLYGHLREEREHLEEVVMRSIAFGPEGFRLGLLVDGDEITARVAASGEVRVTAGRP